MYNWFRKQMCRKTAHNKLVCSSKSQINSSLPLMKNIVIFVFLFSCRQKYNCRLWKCQFNYAYLNRYKFSWIQLICNNFHTYVYICGITTVLHNQYIYGIYTLLYVCVYIRVNFKFAGTPVSKLTCAFNLSLNMKPTVYTVYYAFTFKAIVAYPQALCNYASCSTRIRINNNVSICWIY